MNQYQEKLKAIIKGITSWDQLKLLLSQYNQHDKKNGIKDTSAGKLFEVFTKEYFKTVPSEKDEYKNVWFYNEIPQQIKDKLNLPYIDHGIDILLEDQNDKYTVVQCKFKNDETAKLGWTKDNIANLFACCPQADGFMVFSNASELDKVSTSRYDKFSFYSISDLLQIDEEAFGNIYKNLEGLPIVHVPKQPRAHQVVAINACAAYFKQADRGQLILPCGAGKTLTALWIKEKIVNELTLVLVPSLALLKQIKNDWASERKEFYNYLCVCSEGEIDKDSNNDSIIHNTYELGRNVTTNPDDVLSFLKSSGNKVVFSTYQSLHAIVTAIENGNIEFDFVFCDEAHKTAGIGKNNFSLIHDNKSLPAKKRLYATATPRIIGGRVKKNFDQEFEFTFDMNDPSIFGEEIYRMTFAEAIKGDILVDYKIIAVGVNDLEIKKFIEERNYIGNNISLDEAANNYALEYVMNKYTASHGLTFHSRVKYAKEFAERHNEIFPEFASFSISGKQTTNERSITLNDFKSREKSIISNARCLTEGVDVPAIDLVYFCDPKNSKVDIVQAVGRALRKKVGKTLGYVVVPIYHTTNETLEETINESRFDNLIQVVRSLCDHDERLQIEINALASGKGNRRLNQIDFVFNGNLDEIGIIELIGFEEQLKNALFEQIIEKTSSKWEVRYSGLIEFREQNPNRWPVYDKTNTETEESKLGIFCQVTREKHRNASLSEYWIKKLDTIGFNFGGRDENWLNEYNRINEKLSELDSLKISPQKIGRNNYQWLIRHWKELNNGKLDAEKGLLIEQMNLDKFFQKKTFDDYTTEINKWKTDNTGNLPTKNSNSALYSWLNKKKQEFKNGELSEEHSKKLEATGFRLRDDQIEHFEKKWQEHFHLLKNFVEKNGLFPTPGSNRKLYNWCQGQRQRQAGTASGGRTSKLSNERVELLNSIGFIWNGNKTGKTFEQEDTIN